MFRRLTTGTLLALTALTSTTAAFATRQDNPQLEPGYEYRGVGVTGVTCSKPNDGKEDEIYLKIFRKRTVNGHSSRKLVHQTSIQKCKKGSTITFGIPNIKFWDGSIEVEAWDEDRGVFRGGDDLVQKLEISRENDVLPTYRSGDPNWGKINYVRS